MIAVEALSRADQCVVVVGAGLAGLRIVAGLREAGFAGRIVLVGDERHAPYDRPPLSKAVLLDDGHEDRISLATPQAFEDWKVDLRLGTPVTRILPDARQVVLSSGERLDYDRLVLATGSSLRTLSDLPPTRAGVHYLRRLDDALSLRSALGRAGSVAVVGAGVIGLEVAAAAAQRGLSVTVIEASDRVMGRAASRAVSEFIRRRHEVAGVAFHFGVTVMEACDSAGAVSLRLSDGEVVTADLVVVGIGVTPNTALARDAGLQVEPGGILVDALGATSDPAIYAAGEVALHYNHLHGRHDRQETWAHAAAHGLHVGKSMVLPGEGYAEPASYWSDQYDFSLNVVGVPIGEVDVVRAAATGSGFLVFHLAGGVVQGVSAVNDAKGLRAGKGLIGVRVEPSQLADSGQDLRALAAR